MVTLILILIMPMIALMVGNYRAYAEPAWLGVYYKFGMLP